MEKATIMYLVDDTTHSMEVEGGHISVQMPRKRRKATVVRVSDRLGGKLQEVHLFRRVEHVKVTKG